MADTTGLYFDADVARIRLRNLALDDLEIGAGLGDLRRLHLRHLHGYNFARCHKCSLRNFYFVSDNVLGNPSRRWHDTIAFSH